MANRTITDKMTVKNIFLTGAPSSGKTTIIKKVIKALDIQCCGFYTEEIREDGRRVGFRIKTLDGKTGLLSGVDVKSPYRVGKYKVDLDDFENIALPAMEGALSNSKPIIIDEIGPMELFSKRFKELVIKALDSPNPVIATIKLKGSKFIDPFYF